MFDVVVIGGGIGGYTAAIRGAKKGLKVLLIEKEKLGGTCLHKGCIPTKIMLELSKKVQTLKHSHEWGIKAVDANNVKKVDYPKFLEKRKGIIDQLFSGLQFLMKKNKIAVVEGQAEAVLKMAGTYLIKVRRSTNEIEEFEGKHAILATGTVPLVPRNVDEQSEKIVTSDTLLDLDYLPDSISIMGGGVIGVEFATFFSEMGCAVNIIEKEKNLIPTNDEEICDELEKSLRKKGVNLFLGHEVNLEGIEDNGDHLKIPLQNNKTGLAAAITSDILLVATGRKTTFANLQLNFDMETENHFVKTNKFMETSLKGLYAVGDITGSCQLAHVAAHQGKIAIDSILGNYVEPINELYIPKCIYTNPEIASIGLTESECINGGRKFKVGKFHYTGNGKALISSNNQGFAKVITDIKTDKVVGVHLIGEKATELIGELSLGMLLETTSWEMSTAIHPHPSISEILGEAALAVQGLEING
ncbi:dihydrolipoyl dehydrogenase [Sporosarcina sp. 179-K 3D1 HS]|uniref:dihydrolipoyl dehydrogenase n=1 Tax=Sporosarcina sp. 179-K 3D1 HS TaxID=3232169 RepID=UPI0039A36BBB